MLVEGVPHSDFLTFIHYEWSSLQDQLPSVTRQSSYNVIDYSVYITPL